MNDVVVDKNVDSIKKIHPSKLKKSRELVLSSIGEDIDDEAKVEVIPPLKAKKTMDGLFAVPKIRAKQVKTDQPKVKKIKFKPEQVAKIKALTAEQTVSSQKKISMDSVMDNKQTTKEKEDQLAVDKKNKEPVLKRAKVKKIIKTKRATPIKKKNKAQPRKGNRPKNKKSKKTKKKIKKKRDLAKGFKTVKKRINTAIKLFLVGVVRATKRGFAYSLLVLLAFVFLYSLLASIILNFGNNSSFLTTIASKIKIPAIVSSKGVIYFTEYKTIVNNSKVDIHNQSLFNEKLASIFILDSLLKKHQVDSVDKLKKKLVFDEEVNMAPIDRIRKIKNTIQTEDNFVKIAKKFGDVYQANINSNNADDFSFSDSIKNIKAGETSDVITTSKGYYIVHCFERANDKLSLSYVYIPAVSLDEYLAESAKDYKFWNLTNF